MAELHKAMVSCHGSTILLTGSEACEQANTNYDFCQAMRSNKCFKQWGLSLQLVGAQSALQAALSDGDGYAVSDGLYKDFNSAAAWIIEGKNASLCLLGQWFTPGQADDHSSFCSKLAGILGILHTLTFWPPTSIKPQFRLACDGLSVVTCLAKAHPIDPTELHFDLLAAVWNLMQTSAYEVHLVFVRGHQDSEFPTVLSWDAWLNVEADALAKQKTSRSHSGPSRYVLPGYPWSCYQDNRQVVKQLGSSLRTFINGHTTLQYWSQQKNYTPDLIQNVDWPALGQAMCSTKPQQRRWASKQMSGHFAHGKNMVRWQQCTTDRCPPCSVSEDKAHIITCRQEEASSTWNAALASLRKWLE